VDGRFGPFAEDKMCFDVEMAENDEDLDVEDCVGCVLIMPTTTCFAVG